MRPDHKQGTPLRLAAAALIAAGVLLVGGVEAAPEQKARPAGPAAGEVTFRQGRALRSREGKDEKLAEGSKVWAGDTVKTVGRSKLEIRLADGSALRLGPKSEMKIAQAAADDDGRKVSVGLVLGKAWSKVTSAFGGDSKYEVTTDNAVAGVRGTTFRVNADEDKSTLVRVYSGTVAVAGVRPIYQTHKPGEKRQQVAGPKEVSRGEWEKIVDSMMSVRIGADGRPSEPEKFALDDELSGPEKEWVAWNQERDAAWE